MVDQPIPQSKLEQPSGAGLTTQGATEDELSDMPTVSPSDSDSGSDSVAPAQAYTQAKCLCTAVKPARPNWSTRAEEAKGNALLTLKGASAQNAVPPGTRVAEAGAHVKRRQRRGQPAPGPAAGQVP